MINLPRYVGSTAASLRRFGDFRCHSATSYDASDEARDHSTQTRHVCQRCVTALHCILALLGVSWQNRQVPHQNPTISININIHQYPTPSGSFWNVCLLHLQNDNLPPTMAGCLSHNLFQGLLWCSRSEVRLPKRSTVTLRAWKLTVGGEAQDGFWIIWIWMDLEWIWTGVRKTTKNPKGERVGSS